MSEITIEKFTENEAQRAHDFRVHRMFAMMVLAVIFGLGTCTVAFKRNPPANDRMIKDGLRNGGVGYWHGLALGCEKTLKDRQ